MENKFKRGEMVSLISNPYLKMEIVKINLDGTYKCKWNIFKRGKHFEEYIGNQLKKFSPV